MRLRNLEYKYANRPSSGVDEILKNARAAVFLNNNIIFSKFNIYSLAQRHHKEGKDYSDSFPGLCCRHWPCGIPIRQRRF